MHRGHVEITLLWETLKASPPHPPPALVHAQRLALPSPLRYALVYLLELWNRLTLYQRFAGLPRTNNLTERAIGRTKFRARVERGSRASTGHCTSAPPPNTSSLLSLNPFPHLHLYQSSAPPQPCL